MVAGKVAKYYNTFLVTGTKYLLVDKCAINGKARRLARKKIKRIDKKIRGLSNRGGVFDRLLNNLIR